MQHVDAGFADRASGGCGRDVPRCFPALINAHEGWVALVVDEGFQMEDDAHDHWKSWSRASILGTHDCVSGREMTEQLW